VAYQNYRPQEAPVTINEAIQLARAIEQIAIPLGYHAALAGSCLHAGKSEKDIDILIYAHDPIDGSHNKSEFLKAFRELGGEKFFQTTANYVNRDVVMAEIGGKRVDLFFL
jgi:hypothetical protein